MKFSTATATAAFLFAAGGSSTSAFVPVVAPSAAQSSSFSMAAGPGNDRDGQIPVKNILKNDESFQYKKTEKSQSIPFMNASPFLDGSMAADVGFDPLGFADSVENLSKYREAELRHGRLAMLAAAGWPLSELFDVKIAKMMDMDPVIFADNGFRAPSVLNGGMGLISPLYWVGCLAAAAIFEAISISSPKFNAGLYPKSVSDKDKRWIQTAEIKNGRLAMLAITAFAAQECVSHIAVVDQVPFFFHPITETLFKSPTEVFPGLYDQEAAAQAAASAAAAAVDSDVTATIMESATQVTNEAVSAADAVAAATVEAAPNSAAAAVDTAANTATVMESTTIVPAPPTSVESVVADDLIAAKKRIAELEAQLSSIRDLSIQ